MMIDKATRNKLKAKANELSDICVTVAKSLQNAMTICITVVNLIAGNVSS